MNDAIKQWREYLNRPEGDAENSFDPWEWFPALYGSYSSEFDTVAIEVLTAMLEKRVEKPQTVAHEMFREMLCTSDIANYGTSPRVCFVDHRIEEREIKLWIEKWNRYASVHWGTYWDPVSA